MQDAGAIEGGTLSSVIKESAYEEATHRYVAFLDAHEAELLDFTCRLIATPSPNPPGDERAVAKLVTERLTSLGIANIRELAKTEARPNIIARIDGNGSGPTLILCGHLDTKRPGRNCLARRSVPPRHT